MNEREKKLIFVLFGAAFLIVNIYLLTSYFAAVQDRKSALKKNAAELAMKKQQIREAGGRQDEMNWLIDHAPKEGTHAAVRADLVVFAERSAQQNGVMPKSSKSRPIPLPEDPNEVGIYRTARVKVLVNARDPELYRWLIELQDPAQSRSITMLRIAPQRDDKERVDCELELTQWFSPVSGASSDGVTSN